jgi:transposase
MSNQLNGFNKQRRRDEQLAVKRAGDLAVEKKSTAEIASIMGVGLSTARRYVAKFLATGTRFPSNLSLERVNELRVLEAEQLQQLNDKLVTAVEALEADPEVSNDRKVYVLARALSARSRSNERLAALFGLGQPVRIVEQQLQLQVRRTENRYEITFDEKKFFNQPRSPVPGLIRGGALLDRQPALDNQTNGHNQLPDTEPA